MIFFLLTFHYIFAVVAFEDFIINNEKCKMPNFPAFSEETNLIYKYLPYINCTDLDLLTYTNVVNNTAYLHIKNEYLDRYYAQTDTVDCCYSYVKRHGAAEYPDVGFKVSDCHSFNSTVKLVNDTVWVKCYLGADKIYENVHTTVIVTEEVKNRFQYQRERKKKPLSVLFIVIDSVARLNFERTMPLTKNFILENNFTEFLGYNKIDDNTFPNFNALLTGLNLKQSNKICQPKLVGMLDKCPMIWYDFRNAGYATAYAEDWTDISTFNYLKKGFKDPPTDYYFKTYMEASKTISTQLVDTMPFCAGPESQGERILKVAKDFALAFKNNPSFGIFWMNTFSHNFINSPSRMDKIFKVFFEELGNFGILNDSMVVLLADHGIRFGDIRQTIQGWYEERLPMNFISIPTWFQRQHPDKYENFKQNSKKLTSTYDLYVTLQDVLSSSVENYTVTGSRVCANCTSLFSKIPEKRSCSEAGIPEKWCACVGKFVTNHEYLTPEIKKSAIAFIVESNVIDTPGRSVNRILSSSITQYRKKVYLKFILEADDNSVYLVTVKATAHPIRFTEIVHSVLLQKPIRFIG
ncbi:uncharacterized protein LOC130445544 [Diorhabda sublineata]|uniref:uncharacterized protein LOC130445544 n=1 Tax=Diorhabda sublineata TaxID=1163346 RepID=UPI0024E05108|nr:uncharacterized protein LOC130445544 [Diorhabda sublineata]